MLENTIQEVSNRYHIFPIALSVLSEIEREDVIEEVAKETKEEVAKGTKEEVAKETKEEVAKGTKEEVAKGTKEEVAKETKEEVAKETKEEVAKGTEKEVVKKEFVSKDESIYNLHQQELIQRNLYQGNSVDYKQLFSFNSNVMKAAYMEGSISVHKKDMYDNASETISTIEANNMIQKMQYASILGTDSGNDYKQKRKFNNWSIFNQDKLQLFHKLYSFTGDVDYSKNV